MGACLGVGVEGGGGQVRASDGVGDEQKEGTREGRGKETKKEGGEAIP